MKHKIMTIIMQKHIQISHKINKYNNIRYLSCRMMIKSKIIKKNSYNYYKNNNSNNIKIYYNNHNKKHKAK